ncbi:MAG: hypothetical protein ACI8TA_003081 [Cyclobacteriaceae bacterium]|jgi:hypothetical protein
MKKVLLITSLFAAVLPMYAQELFRVSLSEAQITSALDVLIDARSINVGDTDGPGNIGEYFINLESADVDIQTGNKLRLYNVHFDGRGEIDIFNNIGVTLDVDIEGEVIFDIELEGNATDGYHLNLVVVDQSDLDYTGNLSWAVNLALALSNQSIEIPDMEIALGNSLLPNALSKYFGNAAPVLSTTSNTIYLSYDVCIADLVIQNKFAESGDDLHYTACNSVKFTGEMNIPVGAILLAEIMTP